MNKVSIIREEETVTRKKKHAIRMVVLLNVLYFFLLLGGSVFHAHYSADDYSMLYNQSDWKMIAIKNIRPILALCYAIIDMLHINVVSTQVFWGILLLFSFVFATTKLTMLIAERVNEDGEWEKLFLINLGSLFLFGNAFISEWFYFAEAYIQWMIVAICIPFAVGFSLKKDKKVKNSLIAFVFLTTIAGTYQIALIQYTVILIFIVALEAKGKVNKSSCTELLRAGGMAGIAVAVNVIIAKVLASVSNYDTSQSRMKLDFETAKSVWDQFLQAQSQIWIEGLGTLPVGSMCIILAVLVLGMIVKCVICGKKILKPLLWGILILGIAEGMLAATQIMQGVCWLVMRVCVPIFALYSITIWFLVDLFCHMKEQRGLKILLAVAAVFLGINVWNIQVNALDVLKMNTIDRVSILEMDKMMQKYENETGIQITKVGFAPDAYSTRHYDTIQKNHTSSDICRAFSTSWSDCNSLCYYTGRSLMRVDVPAEIASQFAMQDWDTLQLSEQVVFEGDAVYIAVY